MSRSKTFCLQCHKTNACSCGTVEYQFRFSHKLRPPSNLKKQEWREFLRNCPNFGNVVPPKLFDKFNKFLILVGFKEDSLNGFKFPFEYSNKDIDFSRVRKI